MKQKQLSETQKIILKLRKMGFLNEEKIKTFMKKNKKNSYDIEKEYDVWLSSVVISANDDDFEDDGEGGYVDYESEADIEVAKYAEIFSKRFNVVNHYVEELDEPTDFDMTVVVKTSDVKKLAV